MRKVEKQDSFFNRKRPAIEGLVEDLLGPASQIDELISGNPLPVAKSTKVEDEADHDCKFKNKPG